MLMSEIVTFCVSEILCAICRVKELGPGSAADGKAADVNVAAGGAALSPQKSDLALLRNANVSVFCVISDNYCFFCLTRLFPELLQVGPGRHGR